MRCDDGHYYVVKFLNNPQHLRVLANEFLATRLAEKAGLPVPITEVVEVGEWLVRHTTELNIQLAHQTIPCVEPQAHVKDYFVGDGYSLKFYLSQIPFMSTSKVLLDEEYAALDPTHWTVGDPQSVISATGGKLVVGGGTGNDGETWLQFADKIELGGTFVLQHGDVCFDSASSGVLGGLYSGVIAAASCLAGFNIAPAGNQSQVQAVLNGNLWGPVVTTQTGHRYVFTTRLLSSEVYRQQQIYHSSTHPAGAARGGTPVAADVRVVLELHDIDPSNPATLVAESAVLYDGIVSNAPGFCTYALINAKNLHCEISFSRILQAANVEVRSALPGQNYRTRLTGALADGAECNVFRNPSLEFYPQTMPAPNELISVHYRGAGRALARVSNPENISSIAGNGDDGIRAVVKQVQSPPARTVSDCEQAALAILDDTDACVYSGKYQVWSDFLPGAANDVFPGDTLDVNVPSRNAAFRGIVQQVDVVVEDLAGEHSQYSLEFISDDAEVLTRELGTGIISNAIELIAVPRANVGSEFLPDVTGAEITQTSSTSVAIDAGQDPPTGGGFEIRWSDASWGQTSDRNLAGRFATRSFTLPRLSRVEDYYVRQYDASSPAKYSRYSTALHLDYPL